jgi:subtilisin family serine protease
MGMFRQSESTAAPTLRLFLHPTPGRPFLSLEGNLEGRWVQELEGTWLALSESGARPLTVDASPLDSADSAGLDLLLRMTRSHTTVKGFDRNRGLLTRDVKRASHSWLGMFRQRVFACLVLFAAALHGAVIPGRYIVELSTDSVVDDALKQTRRGNLRDANATAHRARIRTEQKSMRDRIARHGTVLDSTDTVANTLLVEAPDSSVAQIAALSGVRRVFPVREVHMILDHAVVVNKVVEAWNQVSTDRAGLGVKIAIIDSGIDSTHAAFQDATLTVPSGYPKVGASSDTAYTNNKIIVARSYVSMLPSRRDPDQSVRDRVGHGTALAMVAAGVRNSGPLASISGVAPKAFLGNYKVFGTPGYNDTSSNDAILKAMDDAVADGMDIINLSLGDDFATRLDEDPTAQAVERATKAGVIVVVAAGNNGPGWYRISSPATAPSAIAVGASRNDRAFGASLDVPGYSSILAIPAASTASASGTVSGTLADVAALDSTGKACASLPSASLTGKVAIILRGDCTFETKLNLAQRAGAVAAVVYAAADAPEAFSMSVGTATLPAEMISNADGVALRQAIAANTSLAGTLRFSLSAVSIDASRLADFTAYGPNVDTGIKPDLVAVGTDIYVATQKLDPNGDMYDASGYVVVDGTSFSAPLVAGAAALLKSARPGLTVDQYRSLLINSAGTLGSATVQQAGAGVLDAGASLRGTASAYPTALGFGAGSSDPQLSRTLTITNTGSAAETYTILTAPRGESSGPAAALNTLQLGPGASLELPVEWRASDLAAGPHEGYLKIVAASSGVETRVPYWYAVSSGKPVEVSVLDVTTSGRRNSAVRDAVLFRILDAAGLPLLNSDIQVTAMSGGGSAQSVTSYDSDVPGLYGVTVRLGPLAGSNVFRIQAGDAVLEVSITAQ